MKNKIMKKTITMTMAAVLLLGTPSAAYAAGSVTDPSVTGTTSSSNTIDAYGYVGPDATINPGQPPTVTTIDASIPTQMIWAAFEGNFSSGSAPVTSANHLVSCNTGSLDLDVTVQAFTTKPGSPALPGTSTLTLNLGIADYQSSGATVLNSAISGLIGTTPVKVATLQAGETVNMTFNGSYADTSAFPAAAIQPEYQMILKLDAV